LGGAGGVSGVVGTSQGKTMTVVASE